MQNRIEPPILMSRILTFVFATTLVVLAVLGITLYKMFPLDHPQIFFLTTDYRSDLEITLTELPPNDENFELYKRRFVREYIRARNEITGNRGAMMRKWNNDTNGLVNIWSAPDIYNQFAQTGMWGAIMSDAVPDRAFECSVEFHNDGVDIAKLPNNTYSVKFRYFCGDEYEKLQSDYTINVQLDYDAPAKLHWADRRANPLGIRVVGYEIKSGNGDPLDMKHLVGAMPAEENWDNEGEMK